MDEPIQMASPDLVEADVEAVVDVLRSGRLALGPKTTEFEERLREYVGAKHAVAVSSGTAALHLIVRALRIGPSDEVLVPSFTFAASANAVLYEGARPVFVDIDPETFNLDPNDLERKITPRTRAIMAVDVFGHPAEWDDIERIAAAHRLHVIDDSCEALGAEYRGRKLGQFGDAAAFAFYPNKQITTGEGGMVVTDDDEIVEVVRSLRNQGRGAMGAWLEHERLGYNYRLDELSAALGLSQLGRIDELLARRRQVASWYEERLQDFGWLRVPIVKPHVHMSWFVYVVTLEPGLDQREVVRSLQARGVPARGYFTPVHMQPYLRDHEASAARLPVTESLASRTLALPFHGKLTEADVDRVVEALRGAVQPAARL